MCIYVCMYKLDDCVVLLLLQAFKGMFSRLKIKSEALELKNTRLREAICLPDLQVLLDVCVCVCTHKPVIACICIYTYNYILYCRYVPMCVFVHRTLVDVESRRGGRMCLFCAVVHCSVWASW